jgi:hypothetical protein
MHCFIIQSKRGLTYLNFTRAHCHKTFLSVIYEFSQYVRAFVRGKLFQHSLANTLALYENL